MSHSRRHLQSKASKSHRSSSSQKATHESEGLSNKVSSSLQGSFAYICRKPDAGLRPKGRHLHAAPQASSPLGQGGHGVFVYIVVVPIAQIEQSPSFALIIWPDQDSTTNPGLELQGSKTAVQNRPVTFPLLHQMPPPLMPPKPQITLSCGQTSFRCERLAIFGYLQVLSSPVRNARRVSDV